LCPLGRVGQRRKPHPQQASGARGRPSHLRRAQAGHEQHLVPRGGDDRQTGTRPARDLGVDGLVCSAEEAANLRKLVGPGMTLVTPGIRPAGSGNDDQKRVMTPGKAIAAGADYLVVGRPIVEATDPKAAADAIVAEIERA